VSLHLSGNERVVQIVATIISANNNRRLPEPKYPVAWEVSPFREIPGPSDYDYSADSGTEKLRRLGHEFSGLGIGEKNNTKEMESGADDQIGAVSVRIDKAAREFSVSAMRDISPIGCESVGPYSSRRISG